MSCPAMLDAPWLLQSVHIRGLLARDTRGYCGKSPGLQHSDPRTMLPYSWGSQNQIQKPMAAIESIVHLHWPPCLHVPCWRAWASRSASQQGVGKTKETGRGAPSAIQSTGSFRRCFSREPRKLGRILGDRCKQGPP